MDDIATYQIELQGLLDEHDLNPASPQEMILLCQSPGVSLFAVRTDQSGLIGLLRYLHGRGLVLLSVRCEK